MRPMLVLGNADNGAVLDGHTLDVYHFQPMPFEERRQRNSRMVAHVFMEDGCDQAFFNNVRNILGFKNKNTIFMK